MRMTDVRLLDPCRACICSSAAMSASSAGVTSTADLKASSVNDAADDATATWHLIDHAHSALAHAVAI